MATHIERLEVELAHAQAQLKEATKLVELQRADLERYRAAYERVQPNTPERVPKNQLQLAFERVLEALQQAPGAAELARAEAEHKRAAEAKKGTARRGPHGRRRLDLSSLPVERILIDPDDVVATQGDGFACIGEEVSERVAFKPGGYVRLKLIRRKWARRDEPRLLVADSRAPDEKEQSAIVVAPVPDALWPNVMADPSAVAQTIISKYDDSLPLHRQERISTRHGFTVPRSTQCGWLSAAYAVLYRIVEAMFAEALATAFCIATDATGARVRAAGSCDNWHVFVFIADREHVVFRYTEHQTSEAVQHMLTGYRGHLLADAAPVFDATYRDGEVLEVACWFHLRRYFWRALETESSLALEAMALIGKVFEVERRSRELPAAEKTVTRAQQARPILALLDAWMDRHRGAVEPRGRLAKAIGYYDNQRAALHRFLSDGRLRLDNSISEQQLRNVVVGRHNWMFFENETGLRWYCVFRSLISSCALHGVNAQQYLEQCLRLAPHWSARRAIELSPKYWARTVADLDERQRAILERPWERSWPVVDDATAPSSAQAA